MPATTAIGPSAIRCCRAWDATPASSRRALALADPAADTEEPLAAPPDTLLGWLQADLSADDPRPAGRTLAPGDRSIQVHACHGVARQVDVLREVLLGLLADDPTLEPRDVLVMCPDIDTYAPLIEAGFGLGDVVGDSGHPAHRLRVRLADRSPVQTNPLLGGGAGAARRGRRSRAGDAGARPRPAEPVRRRFGFSDDDLEQLDTWARESGVRWAFDAEHRADFGLSTYVANTWEFGLDRLLAGVALSDDSSAWLDRALPLDDVGSAQVDLVGRLTEYVDRLRAATDRLTGTHPLDHWLAALDDGVASLTAVSSLDGWQPGQVQRELGRVRRAATGLGDVDLRLPDVRALLSDRLAGRPTRANFRTGTLTVCTMVPMRSVPHRVVCLLGLDDGVFPRQGSVDGDDVLARDPLTGERDARSEDRQLLLDAILAATQTLVITYTGANEFSGQPRPPAVPLGEVLDALDGTASTGDDRSVSEAVTVRHPLQPFDAKNVSPGELVPGATFSFDAAAAAGARAAAGPRSAPASFLDGAARRDHTGRRGAGRPGALLGRPDQGLPRPRRRRRRPGRRRGPARGRPPRRDRQPRAVGRRRPGAGRSAWPASTRASSSSASGAAVSCRRVSSAGGCSGRSSTAPDRCSRRRPSFG